MDENDVMSDVTINFSKSIQILFPNIQYMKINTKKIEILPGDCNEASNCYYIEFYSIIQWKQSILILSEFTLDSFRKHY